LCPPISKDNDSLKLVQWRASMIAEGLEHISCEEMLRELDLPSLERG